MWEAFKEVWPKTFLTVTFFLVVYGLFCGVRMVIKDWRGKGDKKDKDKEGKNEK